MTLRESMISNNLKNNKVKEVCRAGIELEFWKRQHCLVTVRKLTGQMCKSQIFF